MGVYSEIDIRMNEEVGKVQQENTMQSRIDVATKSAEKICREFKLGLDCVAWIEGELLERA